METQFKHSIKVPNQYKKAAKVLKNSMVGGASVKGQIFSEKHAVNKHCLFEHFIVVFRFFSFQCVLFQFSFCRKRTVCTH